MIEAGFSGLLNIAFEKTDHLWIVVTVEQDDPLAVMVMLTDVRNVENADPVFKAGVKLTQRFTLSKASTGD